MTARPTLRISAADGVSSFLLNLEPEGAEYRIRSHGHVVVTLPVGSEDIEVSWRPEGVSIFRDSRLAELPLVTTGDGEALDW